MNSTNLTNLTIETESHFHTTVNNITIKRTPTDEMVQKYLASGGNVTKCPNHSFKSDSQTIKVSKAKDIHSINGRKMSSIKYNIQ